MCVRCKLVIQHFPFLETMHKTQEIAAYPKNYAVTQTMHKIQKIATYGTCQLKQAR